jgi:hypothetical protein
MTGGGTCRQTRWIAEGARPSIRTPHTWTAVPESKCDLGLVARQCLVSGNAHTRSTVVDFRQRLVPSTRILLPSSKRFEVNYRIKALADSGQKRLASGGKTIALAGAPPASRIVLSAVKNIEEAQAIDDRDGKEVRQSRQSFRTSSTAWHPGVAALAVLTEARRGGG